MTRYLIVVAATLICTATTSAQAPSPATRRAREIVAVDQYGDSRQHSRLRRQCILRIAPAADASPHQLLHGTARAVGRAGVGRCAGSGREPYHGTAQTEAHRDPIAVAVTVEDAAPNRVVGIGQRPPREGAAAAERVTSDADVVKALEQFVGTLARADLFSGTVLLAKDGKTLYSAAFGQANKDFAVPNAMDTKFNLGGMNKMFTSTVIAQLVEQGKLSYEDPLSKFLPDFPSAAAAHKIRIKHLLTHTGGLGSYFNDEFMRSSRDRYRSVDEMMQLAKGDSLAFDPGSRWSYSNTGMLVLGKVIEVVTKQDYFDYVREHLAKPAGMMSTDAYELDRVNSNLAVGYQREFAEDGTMGYRNNIFMHVIRGGPAGGGYSTAEDLLRFATALTSGKLVRSRRSS
jgi:CubicO group peptidase (beta-lactamase class C family)